MVVALGEVVAVVAAMAMVGTTNMSYEQDDDRVTRGVGAIAAADKVSPGRYRRRIETGIATRKRDRAMAAVANGALSGTSVLATIADKVSGTAAVRERDHRATVKAPLNPNAPPPAAPPAASPLQQSLISGVRSAVGGSLRLPPTVAPVAPPTAVAPVKIVPPVSVLIAPVGTAPATAPAVPATVIGGTGPSTQGSMVRSVVSAIFDPIPNAPSVPIVETDNTIRNIALAGGAALAAYLLFFRKSA